MSDITLTKSNYEQYLPLDIVAFSYAEGGAMGCPGEIIIVTFDQRTFVLNHCYGDLSESEIFRICPALAECEFGPFSRHSIPLGWKYYYLGAGNHLVINGRVCWAFEKAKGGSEYVDLYYTLYDTLHKNGDSMRAMRMRVFEETVQIVQQGYYTTKQGERFEFPCQKNIFGKRPLIESKFYDSEIAELHAIETTNKTTITVENIDCLVAAQNIQNKGYNVAVLNMASRRIPGGGVINGAGAQEENLFRRSNLFQSMYQFSPFARKYCIKPSSNQDPLDRNYGGVYTKNATVFRASEKDGYDLLSNPFTMSFISVAGINRPELTPYGMIADKLVNPIKNKIRTIFRIGIENGHDALVLGALGCGAFRNPPKHIAKLFHEVIDEPEFCGQYKLLCFAILEDHNSHHEHNPEGNYTPFYNEFCKK